MLECIAMVQTVRKTQLPMPQFTLIVKFPGQMQSNFSVSLLWPITSPQSQKNKPVKLKFGMKQQDARFCMPNFGRDRWRGGWVSTPPPSPTFHKNCSFSINFMYRSCWNLAWNYVMGILSHAKLEPNRWQGSQYRCPQISIFGQIWSFSVFLSSQPAKFVKKKLMWRHLLLHVNKNCHLNF